MSNQRRIVVDGETFTVTHHGAGQYHYARVSGPNPSYNFSCFGHPPADHTDEDHLRSVREFLAEIAPATGFLREG